MEPTRPVNRHGLTVRRNIMAMWGQALADVAAIRHADDDARLTMREQAGRIEWLLKWQLLEKLRRKIGSGWMMRVLRPSI